MSEGSWLQLVLRLPSDCVDVLVGAVCEMGCLGVEIRDGSHPEPPADLGEGRVELRASFPGDRDGRALRAGLGLAIDGLRREIPEIGWPEIALVQLDDRDWRQSFKAHFRPVQVGRFFIHPGWHRPRGDEGLAVRIDPGMAFGTGLHPSTRLCLAGLDEALPARSLLDVGCGTGVLALAALRAGVARVVGVDDDPQALRESRRNASRNGLSEDLVLAADLHAVEGEFEIVVANILSGTLIALAEALLIRLAPGGSLLLSGVEVEEAAELGEAFERCGARCCDQRAESGWCLLRMKVKR
ncbi:MAG: 50S ribosomal protein L11 methyltransferase [Deltaproteobacteria bacterium]|nr:50S ribosomal protein L11 methyltransferase [Deltaproteobacteria bacterium]